MSNQQNTTENTPWQGWDLAAACTAFCKAFDCGGAADDPPPPSLRDALLSPEEVAATEGALRLAMKAAGVEPGRRCDWWSSR